MTLVVRQSFARQPSRDIIESLVHENKFLQARKALNSQVTYYNQHLPDSLVNYIPLLGSISLHEKDVPEATAEIEKFTRNILEKSRNDRTHINTFLGLAEFYSKISDEQKAYQTYLKADDMAARKLPEDYNLRGKIQNNLATIAFRMNDMGLSAGHQEKATDLINHARHPDFYTLYLVYKSKGTLYYYSYQLDSALFYYRKAGDILEKSDREQVHLQYNKAILTNNIAGIYSLQGKTTEAISAMEQTISYLSHYIHHKQAVEHRDAAREFLFEAVDNLAGIYKSIGDYHRALHLLNYSYARKQKELPASSGAIFKSEILLGQLHYSLRDYSKARKYLSMGLSKIPAASDSYYFWMADGNNALALLHDACGEKKQARYHYELADSIYQVALQGGLDNIYLELLNNKALFHAENNEVDKAVVIAQKTMEYTADQEGISSVQSFQNLVNMANIYVKGGQYKNAAAYSTQALQVAGQLIRNSSGSLLDSVRIEELKPKAILLKARAEHALLKEKNVSDLEQLLRDLQQAQAILERKKMIISDEQDISFIMIDYREVSALINQLQLELYTLTHDKSYLDKIISLHESNVYNKIRSHINRRETIRFHNIPAAVQDKEKQLKESVSNALQGERANNESIGAYFKAEKALLDFREKLRTQYPEYYTTRYATLQDKTITELARNIPDSITVIRFLFIEKDLYALVADRQQQQWISLHADQLEQKITSLLDADGDMAATCKLSHQLYRELWQPLEPYLSHSRVMIIPEGVLYYLSFDMLTDQPVKDYKQLIRHALLNRYAFSYHYSLLAIKPQHQLRKKTKGFSIFAPGFSDQDKRAYQTAARKDTLDPDQEYISLLPLPFSIQLARNIRQDYKAQAYLSHQSTPLTFTTYAGNSAVIHIGTHAESNNEHPEYSRLIFAKDLQQPEMSNSLYLFDIYNYDLSAQLTVLTACETGRPGFHPGEGMISMGHAFNYAGSESILTGLWKIDEQASSMIIEHFYERLKEGLPKDIALQQAKLAYLSQAESRMIQPQYWAGLVIMGDISPIELETNYQWIGWLIGGGIVVLLGSLYLLRSNRKYTA